MLKSYKNGIEKHFSYDELYRYLKHKNSNSFSDKERNRFKNHLENCVDCWNIWNKVRWDVAKGSLGVKELEEYLGSDFIEYFDSSWANAKEWENKKPRTEREIAAFYKNNKHYLYNLILWHESGDREDIAHDLMFLKNNFDIKSMIDYGCGVGTDSLSLLENNIEVYSIDYKCPSVDFFKWRLDKRNLTAKILDVEKIKIFPDADVFFAVDVLEHMTNPVSVVDKLSDKTKIFAHISRFNDDANKRHPFHISFDEFKLNRALKKKGFVNYPNGYLSVWVKDAV